MRFGKAPSDKAYLRIGFEDGVFKCGCPSRFGDHSSFNYSIVISLVKHRTILSYKKGFLGRNKKQISSEPLY